MTGHVLELAAPDPPPVVNDSELARGFSLRDRPPGRTALSLIYDVCCRSRSEGTSNGTFQTSWAYSPTVRSEENHAIRAMLSMLARVQSKVDSQSLSTLLCVAQ